MDKKNEPNALYPNAKNKIWLTSWRDYFPENLPMRRIIENLDINSLERELNSQYFRYQLAIKDGALDSIITEVISRIAELEEKIEKLRDPREVPLAYS